MFIKDKVCNFLTTSITSYKNNECFKQVSASICFWLVKKILSQTHSFC